MKKLLYLEDLWNYYASQNKNVKFNSQDSNTTIVVHINEPFLFSEQANDELNLYAPIRLCHIDKNVNNSSISEKAMKDAMSTAYEMPLLAYIYPDPDNEEQYTFAGHEFYVDENNEIVYEEAPVGLISTKQKLELVYDEESRKTYLDGLAKVWRTYTKAAEILEREKRFSVSVEIAVDDLAYSAKDKVLVINAFRFMGVTILGKSRTDGSEIKPGMQGANITIEDFSEKNNSIFSQNEEVIKLLSELNEKIDGLNIESYQERKEETESTMFEKLLEQYGVTTEDISFEYEGLSDAELEVVFAEHFAQKKKKGEDDDTVHAGGDTPSEDDDDKEDDGKQDDDDEKDDDDQEDDHDQDVDQDVDQNANSDTGYDVNNIDNSGSDPEEVNYYSMTVSKGDMSKTFAVSLNDKIEALYNLVNNTYADADGDFYDVIVYEDSKQVVMRGFWSGKAYRQSYKVKKETYTLVDERIPVKAVYVTDEEEKTLDAMKANYSSMESELASFHAEPEKQAILAEECYAQIAETDAYKELIKQDTHFSMSVDEVKDAADKILLEYAKGHTIEFSVNDESKKTVGRKMFGNSIKKKSTSNGRYGGIFSK